MVGISVADSVVQTKTASQGLSVLVGIEHWRMSIMGIPLDPNCVMLHPAGRRVKINADGD